MDTFVPAHEVSAITDFSFCNICFFINICILPPSLLLFLHPSSFVPLLYYHHLLGVDLFIYVIEQHSYYITKNEQEKNIHSSV